MKKLSVFASNLINLLLIVSFLFLGNYFINVLKIFNRAETSVILQIGIYIILAVSLNVVTGFLGELTLGQAGFMAIGAYVSALFWKKFGINNINFVLGLIFSGFSSLVFAIFVSIPTFRLKGDYLAIITLGFSEIVRVTFNNLTSITGGSQGLRSIPRFSNFLNVYTTTIISVTVIHLIMKSKFGRAIRSNGENEIASMACGISVKNYKTLSFSICAFFTGVAGALYASTQGIITPNEFGFLRSIDVIVMVVLGGMGSTLGSIVSAVFLTSLPLFLQNIMKNFNDYRMIVYSTILILVMIFKPSGIFGTYDFSLARILNKFLFKTSKGEINEKT